MKQISRVSFPKSPSGRKSVPLSAPTKGLIQAVHIGSEYSDDELEFMKAMERYQRRHARYPRHDEVLYVAHCLGYRKVAEPTQLPGVP